MSHRHGRPEDRATRMKEVESRLEALEKRTDGTDDLDNYRYMVGVMAGMDGQIRELTERFGNQVFLYQQFFTDKGHTDKEFQEWLAAKRAAIPAVPTPAVATPPPSGVDPELEAARKKRLEELEKKEDKE